MGVTIKQIAEEVGLSWPAVSQILNNRGRFAPATRKKVIAAAAKHGYRPNSSARALRQQSSKLIGVLFRNDAGHPLTNMSAFEYLLGINQHFQEADLGTLLIRAGEIAQAGDIEPRVFRERLVDGVIVVGALLDPVIERVRTLSPRTIWVDSQVWEETCCVRRDEFFAGQACVRVLARLGYRKITYVSRALNRVFGQNSHHSHASREAGAKVAALESRVQLQVINWPEDDPLLEFETLHEVLRPDVGLVAGSLPVARKLEHYATSLGYSSGHDFGMVCCDDSFETQISWRGLSRVAFDRFQLGVRAAEMMVKLLATPDSAPPSVLNQDVWCMGNTAWEPRPIGSRRPG